MLSLLTRHAHLTTSLLDTVAAMRAAACLALVTAAALLAGCGAPPGTPAGALVGRADLYDYSPSVMQTGRQMQVWWCGVGRNPEKPSQQTDVILYATVDTKTGVRSEPITVLGETPGAWDSAYVCNPRVIRGSFVNPLGDSRTYSYAMYYVATADFYGSANSIGAAFSGDGIHWRKYPNPVIVSRSGGSYGAGQPVLYNQDGKSRLWLFYEDSGQVTNHFKSTTSDGIHFTVEGTLTRIGLDAYNPSPTWGDIGYDPVTTYWYAVYNLPTRDPATTGSELERGQYGVQLYRIHNAALLDGSAPWQLLKTFDTNALGYEAVFLAGLLKDQYGNVNVGSYPKIQLLPSIANPRPGWDDDPKALGKSGSDPRWDIGSTLWDPKETLLTLTRYSNSDSYNTTTGYTDPAAQYIADTTLGHLYAGIQNGATTALFNCRKDAKDYSVSIDPLCENNYIVGLEGYGYAAPPAGQPTVAVYACASGSHRHFVSKDPSCEGSGPGTLLGYVLP